MSKPFTLGKYERLKSKKDIDALFLSGEAFFIFPFKIVYKFQAIREEVSPLQFGITVPKRNFKRAVDRNYIKRLTREHYRVYKMALKQQLIDRKMELSVMFIYTHSAILSYAEMKSPIEEVLKKLQKKVSE